MRITPIFSAITLAAVIGAVPALAQVSVDTLALEPLQKPAPARPAPAKPPAKPPAASNTTVRPNPGGPASPPAGNQPAVPAAPPAPIVLPPPVSVPTRPAPPPTAPPVAADAPGSASTMPGGLRVTFGAGRADLNPATETSIRNLVRGGSGIAAAPENASFTVTSFAAGTPEDPSTARRLSLSRAIAARAVLIAQGVASVRIYVRALGPASQGFADGPPDRVDIAVGPPIMPTAPAKP